MGVFVGELGDSHHGSIIVTALTAVARRMVMAVAVILTPLWLLSAPITVVAYLFSRRRRDLPINHMSLQLGTAEWACFPVLTAARMFPSVRPAGSEALVDPLRRSHDEP